ncbi:methyltransferase [Streptomyces scabiei]|uniref:N5-glutamine S-adenosyl-L-methionine-dependent methyltransferase n=1 Tax=Streptomyces scabiei TaxID=1930 RepID=A0A100JRA2_STRSC|nr:class I SAM-dependent methyltransferase [Streptomyces scabiei]GAQ64171.1 N5-glutamine S-adenosyl-L-methionine-dependent methyltransferase [Streptomyces scabiei]
MGTPQDVRWTEAGEERSARWFSERGEPPKCVVVADGRMTPDNAYGLAREGTALLWRGDFADARRLLGELKVLADQALGRVSLSGTSAEAFRQYRQAQSERVRVLGMLLLPFDRNSVIPLPGAPDVQQAFTEAYGPADEPFVVSLRDVLQVLWAHDQRRKGFEVPALGDRIYPHFGVFTPVRRDEYLDLVAAAPLPSRTTAFDIGTGSGVLSALLAHRGVKRIVATDQEPRALACARENLVRLGLADRVELLQADLFPPGRAALVVCNPPWVPGQPASLEERATYDPEGRVLRGFLSGLAAHLEPGGEGWLIISDFAEHVGLRPRSDLLADFDASGLRVVARTDARPKTPRAADSADPFQAARAVELTSLWRLAVR